MKALSIKQPFAWLICAGLKDVENRNWRIGREGTVWASPRSCNLTLPTRIYVHAGKALDNIRLLDIKDMMGITAWLKAKAYLSNLYGAYQCKSLYLTENWGFGAIIGEVDIVDCVTESDSLWFIGPYGFVLSRPILYNVPIPYKGKLGFFEVHLDDTNRGNQEGA